MKIGIVGLPNVGKSTLFNALTKSYAAEAANFPFCTIEPNVGIVNVADERLEKIRATVNGAKIIPARGVWIELETDTDNIVYVRVDKKRKFSIISLLRVMGLATNEQILKAFEGNEYGSAPAIIASYDPCLSCTAR